MKPIPDKLKNIQPNYNPHPAEATENLQKVLNQLDGQINKLNEICKWTNKKSLDASGFVNYLQNKYRCSFHNAVIQCDGKHAGFNSLNDEVGLWIDGLKADGQINEDEDGSSIYFPVIFMSRELWGTIIKSNLMVWTVEDETVVEYNDEAEGMCNIRYDRNLFAPYNVNKYYRNFLIVCEETIGSQAVFELFQALNGKQGRENFEKVIERNFSYSGRYGRGMEYNGYYCVQAIRMKVEDKKWDLVW